jgi:hypothetical protein
VKASEITALREDISRFVVHLTRDNTSSGGNTASKNFRSILRDRQIRATTAHCLHRKKLGNLPEASQKMFNVTCFTEAPLNQLHLLVSDIPGRSIKLEPYGFCFEKRFLVERGAQQAIHINSYKDNHWLKECVDELFAKGVVGGKLKKPIWRLLPYINAMHERYDFTWEREWRIRGHLKFRPRDLVCVILPTNGEEKLKAGFAEAGIAAISPGWTYEQIVSELARQQRATKKGLQRVQEL